jgi:hypothetical protein
VQGSNSQVKKAHFEVLSFGLDKEDYRQLDRFLEKIICGCNNHSEIRPLMRSSSLIFSLLVTSMSVTAQEQETLTVQQINKAVLNAANGYAKSVSCVESLASPETIFALTPAKKRDDFLDAKYLVFWFGDVGCNMGSGTMTFNQAVVRVSQYGNFYVDPLHSSPAIFGLESRFIEKFVGNSKDTMVVDQLGHNDKDANNFPTLKYRVTYQIDDRSGKWKIINKKQLPYTPK